MFYNSIIAESLSKLNSSFNDYLSIEKLETYCVKSGLKWRKRILTPARTINLFLLQILHKNTSCSHVRHLGGGDFSTMGYCKARFRLPVSLMEMLFEGLCKDLLDHGATLWKGHRIWLVDGTGCSMPDTPSLRKHFGQPGGQKEGCGFPVTSALVLIDATTGMVRKLLASALRTRDISQFVEIHPELEKGDIVVGDRGFCSFAQLMLLSNRGGHAVFRVAASLGVDFRKVQRNTGSERIFVRGSRIKKLGKTDQLLYWQKTSYLPKWMSREQFSSLLDSIVVRELRYKLNKKGFRSNEITIVTTLIDPILYSKTEIAKLYGLRWEIETNIRYLKTTLGMDTLHSKTVNGVIKELFAFCIIYNLVRLIMMEAARKLKVDPSRISFVDAMRYFLTSFAMPIEKIIKNPIRTGRKSPRVVKRRPKAFPRMTKPRNTFKGFNPTEQAILA